MRSLLLTPLTGCILAFTEVDPEQPCLEAGYAIAYAAASCTGDDDLANARFEDFQEQYACIGRTPDDPDLAAAGIAPEDLYECGFAIQQLPCDVVDDFGDDLSAYLAISPACPWILEAR